MTQLKCTRCHRDRECALRAMAELTLPWVQRALSSGGDDWDLRHSVRRALRGFGGSPGFVEDWLYEGAITSTAINEMLETILSSNEVSLALLTRDCRHYLGPQLSDDDSVDANAA